MLVVGWGDAALPLIVPLPPPTLYTTSDSDPVYYLIICQRQCFDAAAKQMQERYEVVRVKTAGQFGRTSYPCRWGVLFLSGMLLIYVVCVVVNNNPCIVYIVLINDLLFLNIFVAIAEGVFCMKHNP